MRGIPEIMFIRILMLMWSFGALCFHAGAKRHASTSSSTAITIAVHIPHIAIVPYDSHTHIHKYTYMHLK